MCSLFKSEYNFDTDYCVMKFFKLVRNVIFIFNKLICHVFCIIYIVLNITLTSVLKKQNSLNIKSELIQKDLQPHSSIIKPILSKKAKEILEIWFEHNRSHPYASQSDITELAIKTNSDHKKIKKWLANKRMRLKQQAEIKPFKCFTEDDKSKLIHFYQTISNHPGPADFTMLAKVIDKDVKKIRQWFNNQRFKERQQNNS